MQVSLEAIQFNHHPTTAATGAFNIRRNETQTVTLPEWRRDSCSNPECAPAAYVISSLPSPLTIKARFSSPDLKDQEVEVQAVAPAGDVLGKLETSLVRFDGDGQSEFVTFELQNARLASAGISANNTKWTWQFRVSTSAGWTEFQQTSHRIYAVLAKPTEPWVTELPWTEVLEVACNWAAGAKDEPKAATMITEQIYALGKGSQKRVTYSRLPTYANKKFDCTGFLHFLRDGVGQGQTVNCDDCATIVSTFANILGCDLWQSGMGNDFRTNYIFIIGDSRWRRTGFPRHAVAWKDECSESDPLYDACLQIDGDGQPDDNQTTKDILPANLLFGPLGKNLYRFCLFKTGTCEPITEDERMRRQLGSSYLGERRFTSQTFLALLKKKFDFDSWADDKRLAKATKTLSLSDLFTEHSAFAGWDFSLRPTIENEDFVAIYQGLLRRPAIRPQKLVDVTLYECAPTASPSQFVLQLLAQFHKEGVKRRVDQPFGDVTFAEPYQKSVLFKHGNFVALVRSVGKRSVSTLQMAKAIEDYFVAQSS